MTCYSILQSLIAYSFTQCYKGKQKNCIKLRLFLLTAVALKLMKKQEASWDLNYVKCFTVL